MRAWAALGFGIITVGLLSGGPVFAFDKAHGKSVACYKKKAARAAHYQWIKREVVTTPGWTETVTEPALYGDKWRKVKLSHAKTTWKSFPAEYQTLTVTEVVTPSKVSWVKQHKPFHGEVMCKVVTPAVTRKVTRKVLVAPARKIAYTTPGTYAWHTDQVVIGRAHPLRVYHPPITHWVKLKIMVAPASEGWVRIPGC